MNLTERAWLQGSGPQTACRWSGDGGLPAPAVRVNARTALITPDAVLALAMPGAPTGMRGCHRRTERLTWAGRSRTRLLADRAPVTVLEHRDRPGRVNTELAGTVLAAPGRRPGPNQTQNALRRSPSRTWTSPAPASWDANGPASGRPAAGAAAATGA